MQRNLFLLATALSCTLVSKSQTNTFPPSGNVGIGTTSPQQRLHVEGSGNQAIFVSTSSLSGTSGSGMIGYVKSLPNAANQRLGYFLLGSRGGGQSAFNAAGMVGYADAAWTAGSSYPAYLAFETTPSGSATRLERMRVNSNGNVGIGTTSPSTKLHVIGRGSFSDGVYGTSSNSGYGVFGGSSSSYNANGSTGVYGAAYYGVRGTGALGVYGTGTAYGLYGVGNGSGTYGSVSSGGYIGAYGVGDSYGVYGYSSNGTAVYGISYGNSTTEGYAGQFVSSSYRGIRVASASGWIAGYFEGDLYTTGTYLTSDIRAKKNVTDFKDAMNIINQLQPKYYEYNHDGHYAKMNLPQGLHYGLIAQDVEKILPQLVRDASTKSSIMQPAKELKITPGAEAQKVEPFRGETIELKAVNYTELIPILVKAMQEQQAEIENLKREVARLKHGQGGSRNVNGAGSLSQATPNPVRGSARISYNLPQGSISGKLLLTDAVGKALRAISLNTSGTIDLNTASLPSGTYTYSLIVGDKILDSKKLIVIR